MTIVTVVVVVVVVVKFDVTCIQWKITFRTKIKKN
jgi:hypothetical protein